MRWEFLLAGLAGCTVLLDLEGPNRAIELGDGGDTSVVDEGMRPDLGDAEPNTVADFQPPDIAFLDAGPAQVIVSDLRGLGGTHEGTVWEGRALRLQPGRLSGTFTSQIFQVEAPVRWQRLRWWPWLPYGKSLPGGRGSERGYPGGNLDMTGNVLLLHLDEEDFFGPIAESSGAGHEVDAQGEELAAGRGVFRGALNLSRTERLALSSDHSAFRFGTEDFTWMLFVRSPDCSGMENNVLMGGENPGPGVEGPGAHMWLGCQKGESCSDMNTSGLGGTQRPTGGPTVNACSSMSYADGRWRHLALVKRGHNPGRFTWYLDGRVATQSAEVDFRENRFDLDGGLPFTIGGFPRGDYGAGGSFDEVAIWHRALSDDEIEQIAARGLSRLSVQVRACVTSDCSEDPPFGADREDDFVGGDELVDLPIELGPSRYVQYRVNLTGMSDLSPLLLRVELVGSPEE